MMSKIFSVLHINQALAPGGSIVVMTSLMGGLSQLGNECCALVTNEPDQLDPELERFDSIILRPRITYTDHQKFIRKISNYIWPKKYLSLLFFEINRLASNIAYTIHLLKILLHHKFDIVHIHDCSISSFACFFSGTPFVYHLHRPPGTEIRGLIRLMQNRAKSIIAISHFVASSAIDRGLDQKLIKVIDNPLRKPKRRFLATYNLKDSLGVPGNALVVGHFGRITPWKGQIEFIKGFAMAESSKPNLYAIVVGEASEIDNGSDYKQRLITLTQDLGVEHKVRFVGYKEYVGDYYDICEIVAHTSIRPEPFGLVIIEAMSMGKAVIASNLGAPPEIIQNNVTGIIANPFYPQEIASGLLKLCSNSKFRHKLGKNAIAEIKLRYSVERISKEVLNIYYSE